MSPRLNLRYQVDANEMLPLSLLTDDRGKLRTDLSFWPGCGLLLLSGGWVGSNEAAPHPPTTGPKALETTSVSVHMFTNLSRQNSLFQKNSSPRLNLRYQVDANEMLPLSLLTDDRGKLRTDLSFSPVFSQMSKRIFATGFLENHTTWK